MRVVFTKCHGSGNDFALVDARGGEADDATWAAVARAVADRRGPIGSDGLLLLTDGDKAHAFGMRMFNSDGSEAETCLNGLRCVARAGLDAIGEDRASVHLKTSSAEVLRDAAVAPGVATIREIAGPATLDVTAWPLTGAGHEIVERRIDTLPGDFAFTAVAMPNPHLVAFVDAVDEIALIRVGSACEAAPDWLPNRANVSFVERRDATTLFVRTFERGVGLTDSCGSAMAASTFAAALTGRVAFGAQVTVLNRGGLVRAQAESDGMVTLSGNATWEWDGAATIDLARGSAGDVVVTRHYNDEIAAWGALVDGIAAGRG